MSWLIDHVDVIYILLGIVALGFITAGWLTRRVKFFVYAAVPLLLIGLIWLLTRFVVTDRQQIEANVGTMADAVVAGDQQTLFKHVSREFSHNHMTREELAKRVTTIAALYKITEVKIWEFEITELSRGNRSAKARFNATVFNRDGPIRVVLCLAEFVLEDNQWKLRHIDFREPAHPDQPIHIPGAP